MKLKFQWIFILLAFILFIFSLLLYKEFDNAKQLIYQNLFHKVYKVSCDITKNYKNYLLKELPLNQDWYLYLKKHPKLQKELNENLSLLSINDVKYIYLLKPQGSKFVFLADGSKTDRALFGETFEPLRKKEYFILKPHFFTHKKLKGIWLTFINPVVVNKKLKAVIVVDVPLNVLIFVKGILERLTKNIDLILVFIIFMIVLLLIFSYFDNKREKEKEKLLKKLESANRELERKVEEKLSELRQKDAVIMNQSKLAALGEMLNMIAHQWRQPLNALSASAIHLELKAEMEENVKEEEVINFTKFVQEETQKLSAIIDDFMKLSRPDDKTEEFYLIDVINEVMKLVKIQLKNHNINIKINVYEYFKIKSYKKVVEHILLNLISNARDALDDADIKNKEIKIYTIQDEDFIKIVVYDNAGPIPQNLMDKIFNPYFTTKEEGKGTGLGLYMSKKLAEEKLEGELYCENKENGVEFILKLKLKKSEENKVNMS